MTYVLLAKALLSILDGLMSYINNRQLMKAGEAEGLLKQMESINEKINLASQARDDVTNSINIDPSKLRNSDEYERKD